MKRAFIVTLNLPRSVTPQVMVDYISDAVKTWKGQLKSSASMEDEGDWYDPLTNLDEDSVRVRTAK